MIVVVKTVPQSMTNKVWEALFN